MGCRVRATRCTQRSAGSIGPGHVPGSPHTRDLHACRMSIAPAKIRPSGDMGTSGRQNRMAARSSAGPDSKGTLTSLSAVGVDSPASGGSGAMPSAVTFPILCAPPSVNHSAPDGPKASGCPLLNAAVMALGYRSGTPRGRRSTSYCYRRYPRYARPRRTAPRSDNSCCEDSRSRRLCVSVHRRS